MANYAAAPSGAGSLDEQSDLGTMWQESLIKYYEECGTDLRTLGPSRLTSQVILAEQERQLLEFNQFRHDKGKLDRLRSLVSRNGDIIQSVATHIATAASTAFPPSAVILTAFNYVMNASKAVSDDYDMIVSFFDIMNSFLERISMLENRMPGEWQFKKFLVNVFSSMLTLCAIARKCRQKGRLSKWAKALIDGSDPKLKGAFDSMHMHLERFESATMIATLKQTVDISRKMDGVSQDIKGIQSSVQQNLAISHQSYMVSLDARGHAKDAALASHEILTVVTRQEDMGAEQAAGMKKIEQALRKIARDRAVDDHHPKDAASRKSTAFRSLQDFLHYRLDDRIQLSEIESTYVNGTCAWFQTEEVFQEFEAGNTPLLWLKGPPGIGKSSLSYSVVKSLQSEFVADPSTSVVYFFFREDDDSFVSVNKMLRSCVIQVASYDMKYRQDALTEIHKVRSRDEFIQRDHKRLWECFFKTKFTKSSRRRLIMVLDGVDEIKKTHTEALKYILHEITTSADVNVQIMCTADTNHSFALSEEKLTIFELTKQHILTDLRKITVSRFKSLNRLRKLPSKTKKKLVTRLIKQADTIRYIEHMLRRLNAIGRERPVLRELDSLPDNTVALYQMLLADCEKSRQPQDLEVLKIFFAWLAYAKKPLSLGSASSLLQLIAQDNSISIDEELEHRCARLLRLSNASATPESESDSSETEGEQLDDEKSEEPEDDSSEDLEVLLGFQERSLRNYFRQTDASSDSLRTPPTQGHVMILQTIATILSDTSEKTSRGQAALQLYAAQNWAQHMLEINPSDVTDEQAASTIESLCSILSNRGGSITKIERSVYIPEDCKSCVLGQTEESLERSLGAIQAWASKSSKLPASLLSGGTLAWMRPFVRTPKAIFIRLADAHATNWLASYDITSDWMCWKSFGYAHQALMLGRELPVVQQNQSLSTYFAGRAKKPSAIFTKESYMAVSKAFLHIDMTSQSYMSIGMSMKMDSLYEASVDQFRIALQNADNDVEIMEICSRLGDSLVTLAKSLLDDEPSSTSTATNGNAVEDASAEVNEVSRSEHTTNIGADAADRQNGENEKDKPKTASYWALQAREVLAKGAALNITITGETERDFMLMRALGNLWLLRAEAELILGDSSHTVEYLVEAQRTRDVGQSDYIVEQLSKREEWSKIMGILRCAPKEDAWLYPWFGHEKIHRAAKETGEIELLVDIYRQATQAEEYQAHIAPRLLLYWAKLNHQTVMGTEGFTRAKALLNRLIDTTENTSLISEASLMMADILLEDFRLSSDPQAKLTAYNELQALVHRVTESMPRDFDPSQSRLNIPLAIMSRKMNALAHQQGLEETFKGCIEALTDESGVNDYASLRTLSRVLACAGLMEDAAIASTCQFYIIDVEIRQKEKELRQSVSMHNTSDESDNRVTNGDAKQEENDANSSSDETDSTDIASPQDNSSKGDGLGQVTVHEDEEDEDLEDEDLVSIYCNDCSKTVCDWKGSAMYLCFYCVDMDLCEDCYQKKLDRESGKAPPHWCLLCPAGHKHVRAPVEHWKGLKNGVMRFDDEGEFWDVRFHDWLFELKETRWPEAWKRYWSDMS